MESTELSWEVTGKRWIRSGIFTAAATSAVWILWEIALPRSSWGSILSSALRFVLLQLAMIIFVLGQRFMVQPEAPMPCSWSDLISGIISITKSSLGMSSEHETVFLLVQKVMFFRSVCFLALATMSSGFLALTALTWSLKLESLYMGSRGAALGLCYIGLYTWGNGHVLKSPIIQRQVYFSLKLGVIKALSSAFRIATISVPASEIVVRLLWGSLVGDWAMLSLSRLVVFFIGAFFIALIWNFCCHFIQVIHTRRYVFAPAPGSAAAETNPTEPLLSVLEDDTNLLMQYLGFLDLFVISGVSERNMESWRRAAFFEESGDTYKKVINLCLRPLDRLTTRLLKGLESCQTGIEKQAQETVYTKESFHELQICSWCAYIVSSLTAFSRTEDRYGVAQLTGSNGAVLSSLISCLLILEVYLGKRSSFGAMSFVGPNGIRWAVPYRGALVDVDRKPGVSLFRKKSVQHRKAHVLADILITAIHRILGVFREEMVANRSVAERDCLGRHKPLFGTPEMHLQKLNQFITFQE